MRFGILGPLEVRDDAGERLGVGGPQQHALLAVFLVHANRVVSADRLIDQLWGAQAPATARGLLRGCVAGLRRSLRLGPGQRLLTRPPGYLLEVRPGECDRDRFDVLAEAASAAMATGTPAGFADAAATWREALACWRGPALDGIPGDDCRTEATRLEERRLGAVEERVEAGLRLGRQAELVAELRALVREHPLRERLWAQLMLALHGSDRRAEALAAYRQVRTALRDQLGVEPGSALRQAHRLVLAEPAEPAEPAPIRRANPAQLPPAGTAFTGRAAHLARLDALLDGVATGMPLAVISGTAGVGKTALAVHWAHRVAARFPDGQLYVNLAGFAPGPAVRPIDALAGFLRALGVPAEQVPVEPAQATALYRTMLSGRRMLVVLDNAGGAEQVRPLLPGGRGCLALVTSRDALGGLVAHEDAAYLALDVLDPPEAQALLAKVLGARRLRSEPQAAGELARLCGFLPLALRIAAANLAVRHGSGIAEHVARLGTGDRLDALAVQGDARSAVRAAFDVSYDALAGPQRRMFRLLGLVPGSDFTAQAAAALADVDVAQGNALLDRLAAAHLVQCGESGRYALHDLLREYAMLRLGAAEHLQDRAAAMIRLCAWYFESAEAAADVLYPHMLRLPCPKSVAVSPIRHADHSAALAWLEAERANFSAMVRHAAEAGQRRFACLLADALRGYFHLRRYPNEWLAVARVALGAARAEGDLRAQAAARHSLGTAYRSLGRHHRALWHYTEGLRLARRAGWRESEATALGNLAIVSRELGRLTEAVEHVDRALALDREIGRSAGVANNLGLLSAAYHQLGRLDEAAAGFAEAVELNRRLGARHGEGLALAGLGAVLHDLGRFAEAREVLTSAWRLYAETGDRDGQAVTQHLLAAVDCDTGRVEEAVRRAESALALARETGDPRTQAAALVVLAAAAARQGRHAEAVAGYRRAYDLALAGTFRLGQIRALIGLARAHLAAGETEAAAGCAGQALAAARSGEFRLLEGRAYATLTEAEAACPQPVRDRRSPRPAGSSPH